MLKRFQCEECGSYDYLDREGSGEDEHGEYEAFSCECGHITHIYYEEDDSM